MGLESPLDGGEDSVSEHLWGKLDHMLRTRGHDLDELKQNPQGIAFADHEPGRFFEQHLQTEDHRVDCCPPAFAAALDRAEEIFSELENAPARLSLITRRDKYMHNSWYSNLAGFKPPNQNGTFVFMHSADARDRELENGAQARVHNENGTLEAEVRFDDDLLQGVVAIPHGWGNKETPGLRVAKSTPGANVNRLLPTGPGSFEPLSSQSHMTGIPVEIERA